MVSKALQLHLRADALAKRFRRGMGTNIYIDKAIDLDRKALKLRQPSCTNRDASLTRLAIHLCDRHEQFGGIDDLEEIVVLEREALELRPQGHPDRGISLTMLAISLFTRYRRLGAMEDLREAIILHRETLGLRPQDHPERSSTLNNLALCLSTRYDQLRGMEDLSEAIVLYREVLELQPPGHPDRLLLLDILAPSLSIRYNQLRDMEDLSEAIVLDREALELRPQGHPERSLSLNNLANDLSTRYNQLGVMEDLSEAIVLYREVLELQPQGNPDRLWSLDHLANCLFIRHKRLGVTEDLNEATVLHRETLELRLQGHPDRFISLSNLAACLSTRYGQLGIMDDLSRAIVLARETLELVPQGHPHRSMSLNNLAIFLSTRYKQLGVMEDLNEAIVLAREALELRPQGHPTWSATLDNLASCLCDRFRKSQQLEDKEEAFALYAQMVDPAQVVSFGDVSAAKSWIYVAEDFQHITTLLAYETFLHLLNQYLATLPSLPRHLPIVKELSSSLAVDAFSACLRNHSPAKAVELLEQGRALFLSQLTRLRSPLDDLSAFGLLGGLLAIQYKLIASQIRHDSESPSLHQRERLYRLNLKMHKVIADIRGLPGFHRFLHPPLFADLQLAVGGGPVIIINTSQYSCDALVILADRDPVHIPFQIARESVRDLANELHTLTERARKVDMTRALLAILRKLWDQFVSPVVELLRTTCPLQSRIWWCPTGDFSLLPLHAAGPYRKGQRNLPDLYISSYTPTLTALIRARQRDPSNLSSIKKNFVAIGQANASGESPLLSVAAELANIGQLVGDVATFTCLVEEESCIPRAAEELGNNEWVHFACHGLPNQKEPFQSAFALRDGHFTIERLIGCNLKNPEFAYLSACHTTVGDGESPDEVIHLASAMQFIGFRSVIGTMWAVDDGETNKITSTFYKHMVDEAGCLDHTRAAYALNKTMRTVNVPLDQRILYIHLGA